MRMKVWGEISGERHLVGTLEMIPGREEQFVYADSYLENEAAQPLSVLLPLREEPFPARQTRAFFRNLLPEGGALAAVAKTLEVKSSSYLKVLDALGSECIGALILESDNGSDDALYGYDPLSREELGRAFEAGAEGVAKLQEEAKLSLAGAQSKMGLYVDRSSGVSFAVFSTAGNCRLDAHREGGESAVRAVERERVLLPASGRGRGTFCARVLPRHHRRSTALRH